MNTQKADPGDPDSTQHVRPAQSNGEATSLAVAGAVLLLLGLIRGAMRGDVAMGSWLVAVLPALVGATTAGNYRRRRGGRASLRHYMLGAYAALAIVVAVAAMLGSSSSHFAAAVLGSGIVGAAFAAMLVAGVKARSTNRVSRGQE